MENVKNKTKFGFFSNIGIGKEKDYLLENLSLLLTSGMDSTAALESIRGEIHSKKMQKIVLELEENIDSGMSLYKALDATGIFASNIVTLIKIGEETGRLPEILKVLSAQQEKDRSFASKIRSAMMYPLFVFGVTIIVGIAIAWFILPRLALVFSQLKIKLPLITKILIDVGTFLGKWGSVAVPLFILVILILFYIIFIFKKTKFIGQAIMLFIGPIGKLVQEVEIARFGFILGTLFQTGVPIVQSLESLRDSASFFNYQRFYTFLCQSTAEGNSLKKSFSIYKNSHKLIPLPIQQLVVASEQSGHLSETLLKVGQIYEEKTEITTKNLTVLLEPLLLVIVWLGVVAVAVAVILPLYSLIGGLDTNPNNQAPAPQPVTAASASASVQPQVSQKLLQVVSPDVGYLNVRQLPNQSSNIVGKLNDGQKVEFINKENGWYQVVLTNIESTSGAQVNGWVNANFVKEL